MKKYLLLAMYVLLTSAILSAQGNLRGNIFDNQEESITGAYVILENTDFYAQTDNNGAFQIYGIPAGEYVILVSYIGYDNVSQSITIMDGETANMPVILTGDKMLEEVVINGRLEGQAKALNAQKNSLNINEVIAREQIERFPDANIGDALKRISGINVQYDQGEARFANIRGTAPELSSVTINGERVPSAEGEKRYVQLDLIPADIIETIEVNKAVTPDMDGDAIGGSINLRTQKAQPNSKIKGTIGSGYSLLTNRPIYKGMVSYSNRFANNKIGLIVNASILDKQVRSDNVESEWDYDDEDNKDGSAYPTEIQVRQYHLERLRQSYSATLDYAINKNHNVYATGMYNWRNDWENRYRVVYTDIEKEGDAYVGEIRRETKGGTEDNKFGRLEDQRMKSISLGGDHFFNKLKMNWTASVLQASEVRPNERYMALRAKDAPLSISLADQTAPIVTVLDQDIADYSSSFGLKDLTEEFGSIYETDMNAKVNFELPILYGNNASFLKFGLRYKNKTKSSEKQFYEYEPADEESYLADALNSAVLQTEDNFSVSGMQTGSFVSNEFLGNTNFATGPFEGEEVLEELAGDFEAHELVTAGYVMYTQNVGSKWTILGGVRVENTQLNYQGKQFDGENLTDTQEQEDSYVNVLPGVHIKYSPTKWTNVKVAWTNTLARPNYFDLVPYRQIETEDNEISIGNSSLTPTTSMNFDLLFEQYFKNIGILSGGVFYKNLSNVIASKTENDFVFEGNEYDKFTQPVNAGNADLIGFEFGLQRRLDFLPGFLNNLSLYANYTFTQSTLKDITLEDREDEILPLVGTPKNLLNLSLAYDTKRLDLRLSYNFADKFIEEYDDETFYDRWYDAVNYLDFNADFEINKSWKVYFSVNNILDQPLRYYQGVQTRTMQTEYYGMQTKIGLKFSI